MTRQEARAKALEIIRNPENTEGIHEKIADAIFDAMVEEFEKATMKTVSIPDESEWPERAVRMVFAFDLGDGTSEVFQAFSRYEGQSPRIFIETFQPVPVRGGWFLTEAKAIALAQAIQKAPKTSGGIVISLGDE